MEIFPAYRKYLRKLAFTRNRTGQKRIGHYDPFALDWVGLSLLMSLYTIYIQIYKYICVCVMCIHGGLFVCFRKECSAQLLAYASRRLLSMPIVVVQSCFLPLIFFFLFPSASFCYRQQNWEDLYIQHSCCARGPRRGKPTRIKLFRLWRSLFVVVAHNNSQRNKTFPDLVRVTEGGAKSFFLFVTLGGVAERRAKNINLHGWEWLAYRDNSPSSPPALPPP